jgi:hypothetical protein
MSIFIWQSNFMAKFNFEKKTFQWFSRVFFLLLVSQYTTLLQAQVWQPGSGVMDIDGNQYPTLLYGNGQEWMGENLRTTKYTDGTPITYITTDADWMALKQSFHVDKFADDSDLAARIWRNIPLIILSHLDMEASPANQPLYESLKTYDEGDESSEND